ncbi:MAG: hypothetical protein QNJ29_05635 [Rhizobiaceae bacterium]|nr:hypothetical protein [Rhizobiaceae bacterium]
MRNTILSTAAVAISLAFGSSDAKAEVTECVEITSVPAIINTQGVYCLKSDLSTNIPNGAAITVNVNNVTIDFNGWKLGGAAAGPNTSAIAIRADSRRNLTVRNGIIRGFGQGILLNGGRTDSIGHTIEDMLFDNIRGGSIASNGSNVTIRQNKIINIGASNIFSRIRGINAQSGTGIIIEGNTVSGVDETDRIYGIRISNANDVKVTNNNVFDLKNASEKYGIYVELSDRVLLKNNTVSTGAGGNVGIGGKASSSNDNIACIGNEVSGFTFNYNDCDTVAGNISY